MGGPGTCYRLAAVAQVTNPARRYVVENATKRRGAIDRRTARHEGHAISQRKRKRVEELFGWIQDRSAVAQDAITRTGPRTVDVHAGGKLQKVFHQRVRRRQATSRNLLK